MLPSPQRHGLPSSRTHATPCFACTEPPKSARQETGRSVRSPGPPHVHRSPASQALAARSWADGAANSPNETTEPPQLLELLTLNLGPANEGTGTLILRRLHAARLGTPSNLSCARILRPFSPHKRVWRASGHRAHAFWRTRSLGFASTPPAPAALRALPGWGNLSGYRQVSSLDPALPMPESNP